MARRFNGTSDELSTADLGARLAGGSAATLAAWVYRGATGRTFDFGGGTGTTAQMGITWYGTDNRIYCLCSNSSEVYCYSAAQSLTGWHHVAAVFDGSLSGNTNRVKLYFDGAAISQAGSQGTVPATLAASLGTFRIGRSSIYSRYSNADAAEVAAWNAALSAAEIASLAAGFSPGKIRLGSLAAYLPLIGPVMDLRGNAWTTTGASEQTHPRVIGR